MQQLAFNFHPATPGLELALKALIGRKSRKLATQDVKKLLTTIELKQGLGRWN